MVITVMIELVFLGSSRSRFSCASAAILPSTSLRNVTNSAMAMQPRQAARQPKQKARVAVVRFAHESWVDQGRCARRWRVPSTHTIHTRDLRQASTRQAGNPTTRLPTHGCVVLYGQATNAPLISTLLLWLLSITSISWYSCDKVSPNPISRIAVKNCCLVNRPDLSTSNVLNAVVANVIRFSVSLPGSWPCRFLRMSVPRRNFNTWLLSSGLARPLRRHEASSSTSAHTHGHTRAEQKR